MTRNPEPRRTDDVVLRALASETLNAWLGQVSRKFVVWFVVVASGTLFTVSWAASAWATNATRNVQALEHRVDSVELVQRAQIDALRDQTEEMRRLRWALDSLRITLQRR